MSGAQRAARQIARDRGAYEPPMPAFERLFSRGSAAVARRPHTPKVAGSIPAPATRYSGHDQQLDGDAGQFPAPR
jgi:uncharacterized protein (DUF1501 family)